MAKAVSKEEMYGALVRFLEALTALVSKANTLLEEEARRKKSREHI